MDGKNELVDAVKQMLAKKEVQTLVACNERTKQYGLVLSEQDALALMECRNESLKQERRLELSEGILKELIDAFCDSQFLSQENYVESLERLQAIFYEFKNESMDLLTDEELFDLDYPVEEDMETLCGIDRIYRYLQCVEKEQEELSKLPREMVVQCLTEVCPE